MAKSTFVPYLKSIATLTNPSEMLVSILSRFSVVASAASSGLAIVSSSTAGSTPGLLTLTLTFGYTMRGSRSTGIRPTYTRPSTSSVAVIMIVPMGRLIDQLESPRRCLLDFIRISSWACETRA